MAEGRTTKYMEVLGYLYLIVPFFIFSIGWMKKEYWIPIAVILVVCFWKAWKDAIPLWMPKLTKKNVLKITTILSVVCIWVVLSGVGKFVFQNADHFYRNGIFEALVEYQWPIRNDQIIYPENFSEGTHATSLIYYIGFWLPAAVIGKLFGVGAGYVFQAVWAVLGIVLAYYFICARKEKLLVWPLFLLVFFSGLDIVGHSLSGSGFSIIATDGHLEWWAEKYQYSSNTTQLFWVFNQAVPAWVCTGCMMVQKNNKSIVWIFASCMLSATFPFVGLLPFTVFWMFGRKFLDLNDTRKGFLKTEVVKKYLICWTKDTMTIQNVLGGGIIGIFSFLYLTSNTSGHKIMESSAGAASGGNQVLGYLVFFILEAGVYLVFLYRYQKKNVLYYVIFLSLLVIPAIRVGGGSDFCMRASIPALFLLMVLVIDGLERAKEEKNRRIFWGLVVMFLIGSITPIHEIGRTFHLTTERFLAGEQICESVKDPVELLNLPNFSGKIDESFFFEVIGK